MEKKDLIIGAFTGYNYNQLKPWAESIDECGFTGDKVVVVQHTDENTLESLTKQGFQIVMAEPNNEIPIHVLRFLYIYEFLRNTTEKYRYVVTTDVKDVYFQVNPIEWLKYHLIDGKKLVAGSEGMLYKDEPWGNENLMQTYGPYIHSIFKDNEIYNVGTIGGEAEYVKDLTFNIFTNSVNRPIRIVDQAVYNVLLNTQPYKNITYFAKQSCGWACQAGTTVDPSKIETFRPFLTESEPLWQEGKVLTGEDNVFSSETCSIETKKGTPFCIVHQYDRVPEWKKFVQEKYKQQNPDEFFTYRTA